MYTIHYSKEELSIVKTALEILCEQVGSSFFEEDEAYAKATFDLFHRISSLAKEETQ